LWLLPIRVPEHAIWPCLMLQQKLENIAAEGGPSAEAAYLDRLAERDPWLAKEWSQFRVVADIHSLSLRREPEYREARSLADSDGSSVDQLVRSERASIVRETVEQLKPRDAAFIKMKYGFEGEEQTLEAIGIQFGITRERVRQRLAKAHELLAWKLKFLKERAADTDGRRLRDAEGESDQPETGCENGLEGDPVDSSQHETATATG